jgi:hypothetical protein
MNKRISYLLATLLIAESAIPLAAQSIDEQARTLSAINTNYSRTTSGGITVTPPITTGPAIDIPTTTEPAVTVKMDKIYATEIADARAKVYFQLHNVELKKKYTEQAGSLHVELDSSLKLSSITANGEVTNKPIESPGVVAIYDSKNFTFEFTAKNISPDSIRGNSYFTFKIPGWLLTDEVDLEVKVFIEQDTVSQPTVSVNSTSSSGAKIVNLDCNTKYSNIRYTLDGSDVTLASPLYNGTPIAVNSPDTLKAVAFVGTIPSEQIVVEYNHLPSDEDSNDSANPDSDNSESDGDSNSNTNPDSDNSESDGDSNSSTNPDSDNSNSNKDNDNLVEIENTPTNEDLDQLTSDITNTSTVSNNIPKTVSNTVTTLIQQKDRNLTTRAKEVQYGLTINNQNVKLENKLLASNGKTLAPLRTITEALNIPIHYHAESKTAIIKIGEQLIEFPLGYNVAVINGEIVQIDADDPTVMSTIQNGRTYLPLKFIAEQLNLNIHFDGTQVYINSVK